MAVILRKLHEELFILNTRDPVYEVPRLDDFRVAMINEHELEVEVQRSQDLNSLFAALSEMGIHVVSMRNKANRLEEFFFRLTERKKALIDTPALETETGAFPQ